MRTEQAANVLGRGREHDLEARDVDEPGLELLRVLGTRRPAGPALVLMVSGTFWPPDIVRCLAAWFTSCSIESVRKSSYMISTTGRMPWIAAPMPLPTIAISEIGVLQIRSVRLLEEALVTAIDPPISAMSSPMMKTLSSWRSARAGASRTASRYVISGIDVLERVFG